MTATGKLRFTKRAVTMIVPFHSSPYTPRLAAVTITASEPDDLRAAISVDLAAPRGSMPLAFKRGNAKLHVGAHWVCATGERARTVGIQGVNARLERRDVDPRPSQVLVRERNGAQLLALDQPVVQR
ncbi:MAG TPA: hypothetical protein VHW23_27020 [Kofleriaceae bacterium]|jgi:hypothetical protein|nr:hypothetical protein [Kofleriaceae bacterium]